MIVYNIKKITSIFYKLGKISSLKLKILKKIWVLTVMGSNPFLNKLFNFQNMIKILRLIKKNIHLMKSNNHLI